MRPPRGPVNRRASGWGPADRMRWATRGGSPRRADGTVDPPEHDSRTGSEPGSWNGSPAACAAPTTSPSANPLPTSFSTPPAARPVRLPAASSSRTARRAWTPPSPRACRSSATAGPHRARPSRARHPGRHPRPCPLDRPGGRLTGRTTRAARRRVSTRLRVPPVRRGRVRAPVRARRARRNPAGGLPAVPRSGVTERPAHRRRRRRRPPVSRPSPAFGRHTATLSISTGLFSSTEGKLLKPPAAVPSRLRCRMVL